MIDGDLYQANRNYRNSDPWYDNVNVEWATDTKNSKLDMHQEDSIESQLVPAQLCLFFKFKLDDTMYCVIHSCHYKSKDISVLGTMWIKEYKDKTLSSFLSGKLIDDTDHLNAMQPYLRIIKCKAIYSQCMLIPYQATSCIVIKLNHPTDWPEEFFAFP